jgi:hypothetical protein
MPHAKHLNDASASSKGISRSLKALLVGALLCGLTAGVVGCELILLPTPKVEPLTRPNLHAIEFMPGAGGSWCITQMERDALFEDLSKLTALVEEYEAMTRVMRKH